MFAFIVRHKPTGTLLTPGYMCSRKTEVLRKTRGTIFTDRNAAKRAIGAACSPFHRPLYPKVLHGATKRDFEIKPFEVDLDTILGKKGKRK